MKKKFIFVFILIVIGLLLFLKRDDLEKVFNDRKNEFIPKYFQPEKNYFNQIPDTKNSQKTFVTSTPNVISEEMTVTILTAIESLDLDLFNNEDYDAALQTLAQHGDLVFDVVASELFKPNLSEDDHTISKRIKLIDFLGFAAKSNSNAAAKLEQFALSPIDHSRDLNFMHMDLSDRLEAFSYLAALNDGKAKEFISQIKNPALKHEYVYSLYLGYRLSGLSDGDAIARL